MDDLIELRDRAVDVVRLSVIVERDLGAGAVEGRVGLDHVLELRASFGVVAATLVSQPRVVLSFRKRTPSIRLLRIRRGVELLGNSRTRRVVPILLLVVCGERVEGSVEVCRSFLADG